MAATDGDFVISGTGSNDGYANVWRLLNWFDDDWYVFSNYLSSVYPI